MTERPERDRYSPERPRSAAARAAAARSPVRQPFEVLGRLQHESIGFLVGEHVLPELRAERAPAFR